MRISQQKRLESVLSKYEITIRDAFLSAVADIRSTAVIKDIIKHLEAGNIEGAISAVNIDNAAFNAFADAIRQTYVAAGLTAVAALPSLRNTMGNKAVVRFDARNIRAEQWLQNKSGTLITAIVEDQRSAIKNALTAGMQAGRNPRSIALDVVGRVEKSTGKRIGGVIGLTTQQSSFVGNARKELLSGDPQSLRSYLARTRRDKRFDRTVLKAIETGEAIPDSVIAKMLTRYEATLLKIRGDTIARTEAMESLNAAQQEAMEQTLEKTDYTDQDVERVWRSASDARVRDNHRAMNGQAVNGTETPFITPDGYSLKYPGDRSLGAPASEIINCRCIQLIRLNYMKDLT